MVFAAFISLGVGLYSEVYIAQKYQLPNKDETREICKDLKTFWSQKLSERCLKRRETETNAQIEGPGTINGNQDAPITKDTLLAN